MADPYTANTGGTAGASSSPRPATRPPLATTSPPPPRTGPGPPGPGPIPRRRSNEHHTVLSSVQQRPRAGDRIPRHLRGCGHAEGPGGTGVQRCRRRPRRGRRGAPSGAQARYADRSVAGEPRVQAFRAVYRRFGSDPGQRRPSAEAVASRAKNPAKAFPRNNAVVDVYNITSAELLLPMAAYDLARVAPPITLRLAAGGEEHVAIGESAPRRTESGEIVYADRARLLCRCLNWRDGDFTKVTTATREIVVFVDGGGGIQPEEVCEGLEVVCRRLMEATGARRTPTALVRGTASATVPAGPS